MGGCFFGALAGIVGTGSQIAGGEIHIPFFITIVAGSTAIGALIGFFFLQIFVGQFAVRGPVRQPVGSEGNFHEIGGHEAHTEHGTSDDAGIDSDH